MSIPIRNLYYIFTYAWGRFPQGDMEDVGIDFCPDLLDLFAHLLVREANSLIRRGLARDYEPFEEELATPRGRIALAPSIARQSRLRGRIVCRFDDFTPNRLVNQIVKATTRRLARSGQVSARHGEALRGVVAALAGIDDIRLDAGMFRQTAVGAGLRRYRFILSLCEFLYRSWLPASSDGGARFADVLEDEAGMAKIFESFLRNFYAHEQKLYSVRSEVMSWDAVPVDDESAALLPGMATDITLRAPGRTIVIDAKYYREALTARHGKPRVRSGHLYQLFAYLEHAGAGRPDAEIDGLLIYPVAAHRFAAGWRLRGHGVRAQTLDLMLPWPEIHDALLEMLAPVPASVGGPSALSSRWAGMTALRYEDSP